MSITRPENSTPAYDEWFDHVSYYWDMLPHDTELVEELLEGDIEGNELSYLEIYKEACLA